MKRETKFRIYARLLLALSIFCIFVGVVLNIVEFLISGVLSMVLAMWQESDANALFWEQWCQENKDLIKKQKERTRLR